MTRTFLALIAGLTALAAGNANAAGKPLKVYILAGQSNMEGHARVETFDHLADDPATKPLLDKMRGPDGKPKVYDRVRVSYFTGPTDNYGEGVGPLTTGFGARKNPAEDGGKIGPEFTFGIAMQEHYDGPILLIKTAWGGKSLNTDFRPPSAGPYEITPAMRESLEKRGKDVEAFKAEKAAETGKFYKLMIDHAKKVLADPARVHPDYDPKAGVELAGFVWFQGWNDMVDSGTYPNRDKPNGYALYTDLMADFIRDVRKDLAAPKLPFVIGVMGVGGPIGAEPGGPKAGSTQDNFRTAMAATADLPEFQGTVVAVQTGPYWSMDLSPIEAKFGEVKQMEHYLKSKHKNYANKDGTMTPADQKKSVAEFRAKLISPEDEALWTRGASNAGYHYLGSGKTFALMGQGFARALLEMKE